MKLKVLGHYVTIFNTKDESQPAGLNVDGVYVGKYNNLEAAMEKARKVVDEIERVQSQ